MILYIENLLPQERKQDNSYQWILWGIEITSLGMAISFPFHGYAFFSILFSTTFIFFTYAFSWVFLNDLRKIKKERPVKLLSVVALASLVVSSGGPYTLAYIMASHTGNALLYRDAIYSYLHFQYNGFFTFSIFAIFFNAIIDQNDAASRKRIHWFAIILSLSVLPSLFLSLLWKSFHLYVEVLSITGCLLIALALFLFLRFAFRLNLSSFKTIRLAKALIVFSLVSFAIKMLLQTGTIIPSLRNAVFGYRPIIIGFLHLVFLGFVTFFILSDFLVAGIFSPQKKFSATAIIFFSTAIIINETILLIDGMGLMFYSTNPSYPWLLWGAAILLLIGAILMLVARLRDSPASAIK
jgi:MFS family permease